ncbi:CHAD domain-containing protein [Acidianus manzaensis]|uniref:CHAD domain-containing protein n=1 Tax=Acidianus manzaensis TaxID=282676 RepID=A0A1W6JZK3_9CREN|nr:CHAD domain-containing protein [Acidianus manzaensis]ARM75624.1 hypothetical protein B6F84_05945 [Acidianus manzaensis]
MRILRPEYYANNNLHKALKINGTSKNEIHDMRVYIRKYFDVLYSIYPIYYNPDCLLLTKDILHTLGKIRDADICSINLKNRDLIALRVIKKAKKLSNCVIRKVYGSRLLVYDRIVKIYLSIPKMEDFHELRKNVRMARDLIESLGYDSKEIKALAKKMGDLRDQILRSECNGLTSPEVNISIYSEEARKAILKVIIAQDEFHHFKNTNQKSL